ncbi:hypothetical protein A8135_00415 [Legionella jamestowniensis]|uniref:Transmembrane protein n=1 Tax=Legionella jamestowniensis TaxID=455 RepID=A0ABX2XVF3_9GAMM|nr:hypothetical protein [Legionella jamestowniensis]OCH98541.1 hypothetical protein A8135_00415 [Legionella jamestowniensis]
MERSRFQQNSALFIIGIIALVMSIVLFVFSIYIIPFLFWDWIYDVPEFISIWREWLKEEYNFTHLGATWSILIMLLAPAFVCGYLSYLASNYIDNRIYNILPEKVEGEMQGEIRRDLRETLLVIIKVLGAIILVLIIVSMVQWFLAVPAPIE